MPISTIKSLYCCCCGGEALGRQWFNRDTGHGICQKCADAAKNTESPERVRSYYGIEGWHFGSSEKPLRDDLNPTFIDGTDAAQYQESIANIISKCADAVSEEDEVKEASPLEWPDLWLAMKASPDQWVLTTDEMFDEMLGCVPPAAMRGGAFLTGEADRHNSEGKAVYSAFKKEGKKVFAKYMTRAEFLASF